MFQDGRVKGMRDTGSPFLGYDGDRIEDGTDQDGGAYDLIIVFEDPAGPVAVREVLSASLHHFFSGECESIRRKDMRECCEIGSPLYGEACVQIVEPR